MLNQASESDNSTEVVERPGLLDVVKIDDRWAQMYSATGVVFLDDQSIMQLNWDDHELVKSWRCSVKLLREIQGRDYIPSSSSIHWGPEQKNHPELKEHVTVFGEYRKKNRVLS